MPVARAPLMLRPLFRNRLRFEIALAFESRWIEQPRSPVFEGPTQPVIDRYPEAHLGAVYQRLRHIPAQQLTQWPLPSPVADPEARRNTASELHHAMVEKGCAGL